MAPALHTFSTKLSTQLSCLPEAYINKTNWESCMVRVGERIEDFEYEFFQNGDIKKAKFLDYRGKWLLTRCGAR